MADYSAPRARIALTTVLSVTPRIRAMAVAGMPSLCSLIASRAMR